MRSGDLDRRVDIQERHLVTDERYGEQTETWATVASVWAKLEELGGSEFLSSDAKYSQRRCAFTIRWRDDVSVVHRLVFEDHDFDIKAITEIGRRSGLKLLCEATR